MQTPQFIETMSINTDQICSFICRYSKVLMMGGWSKTSHITNKDQYLTAFTVQPIAAILLEIIGSGLQEAESLLMLAKTKVQAKAQVHHT